MAQVQLSDSVLPVLGTTGEDVRQVTQLWLDKRFSTHTAWINAYINNVNINAPLKWKKNTARCHTLEENVLPLRNKNSNYVAHSRPGNRLSICRTDGIRRTFLKAKHNLQKQLNHILPSVLEFYRLKDGQWPLNEWIMYHSHRFSTGH